MKPCEVTGLKIFVGPHKHACVEGLCVGRRAVVSTHHISHTRYRWFRPSLEKIYAKGLSPVTPKAAVNILLSLWYKVPLMLFVGSSCSGCFLACPFVLLEYTLRAVDMLY